MFSTHRIYVGDNEGILSLQQIPSLIYRDTLQDVQWVPEAAERERAWPYV